MYVNSKIKISSTAKIYEDIINLKNKGKEIISLNIGDVSFEYSRCLGTITKQVVEDGHTKYTEATGVDKLKDIVLKKFVPDKFLYDRNNVIISNGAKQCISNCLMALLTTGDEVIIPVPYWSTYVELVKLYGAKPILVDTEKNNFKLKSSDIEKHISNNTKVLIINNPNNPTGQFIDKNELTKIVDLSLKYNFYIISDEIYREIYSRKMPESILNTILSNQAKDRLILINGMSKSYGMSGFRIGFMISSSKVANYVKCIQSNVTSNPNTIAQFTAIKILKYCDCIKKYINNNIRINRRYAIYRIKKIKGIDMKSIPQGGFYVWFKVNINSNRFCEELLLDKNVALMPGEAFGLSGYVRLSYCCDLQVLKSGLDRIEEYTNKLKDEESNYGN